MVLSVNEKNFECGAHCPAACLPGQLISQGGRVYDIFPYSLLSNITASVRIFLATD